MPEAFAQQRITGWGRSQWADCFVFRPEKRRGVAEIFAQGGQSHYLARGLGRSYNDAAINGAGGVISLVRLDRMLDFDEETGVLECEAGVTFKTILDTFVPRGYFLPVTPGTKFVTVGGAIAHDVHGKNHHRDGTFGDAVIDFELLSPEGEVYRCSRAENPDFFWATLGGIGLTGVILTVRFRMIPIETAYFVVDTIKTKDIDASLSVITESDSRYQYSVAWVDCLARGKHMGRCVFMPGNHAAPGDLYGTDLSPLHLKKKREVTVPFDLPAATLNRLSIRAANSLYYHKARPREGQVVDYDSYFYPLDGIHDWNRAYGKPGFVQFQCLVPTDEYKCIVDLIDMISRGGRASFIAVLKRMGPANEGHLSFPFEGFTLTVDFPMRPDLVSFLHELNAKLLDHGGRIYLAKDMGTSPATFRAMYPELERFQEVRSRLDPHNKLSSNLSRRLEITE